MMKKNSQRQNEEKSTQILGDREEQVTCHASALVLAMTEAACREAEM